MSKKNGVLCFSLISLVLLILTPDGSFRAASKYYCESLSFSEKEGTYTLNAELYEISSAKQDNAKISDAFSDADLEKTFSLLKEKYPNTLYKSLKVIDVSSLCTDEDKMKILISLFNDPHLQQKCTVLDKDMNTTFFGYLQGEK